MAEKRKVSYGFQFHYGKSEKLGYDSPTQVVCVGLELLVNGHNMDIYRHNPDTLGHNVDTSGHIPDTEIESLKL